MSRYLFMSFELSIRKSASAPIHHQPTNPDNVMKKAMKPMFHSFRLTSLAILCLLAGNAQRAAAIPAVTLFEDDFNGGIPGWSVVQPAAGTWVEPPLLWQFDKVSNAFSEQSNIYTGASGSGSPTRLAVMLISDYVAPTNFGYTARLTAGDDDGFGLIWAYENETTFYRIAFNRQAGRTGWPMPYTTVDRMSNNAPTDIFGPDPTFVNTLGRPFDVSVGVTNGLLTVIVTDDPLGVPVVYNLATAVALPAVAEGKVGMFSWGMDRSGPPRSFRIQNPVVNGVALDAAAVSQVLSNWAFTITPSATNNYTTNLALWSQGLNYPTGDKGVMMENNDSAPENVATSTTNTPVNAAYAGDLTWSNYVYSVRFNSADDDGFGMFLRWQDRTNWYRIMFRNQTGATTGVKRGISVQKNVNKTFDQMLASTAFIPPVEAAFDVHAAIRDNSLQIVCVVNPDSTSPTISSFGPINMAASTLVPANLSTGMVGVASWGQYGSDDGTKVDSVKVRKVDGEGLLVSSLYGPANPPPGLNDLPVSGSVTANVPAIVTPAAGVRHLSTGWSGSGSVPTSGVTNEVIFTLTQFSFLTWKWQTQYQLAVNSTAGGTAVASAGPWINISSNASVTATPNAGYMFTGWSGDSLSTTSVLSLTMTRPFTLTANFAADSDGDQLPDAWELQYFGNLAQTGSGNPDGDGSNTATEYLLGTNPNYSEGLVMTDGLAATKWINEGNDRAIPGTFVVTNFGTTVDGGFRGVWEISNQNRAANSAGPYDAPFISTLNYATNASFQGPIMLVRSNYWDPAWATAFSFSSELTVGDNDGNCVYFRYLNASNWYRVTLCAEAATITRPLSGVSIQKRTNGWFANVPASVSGNLGFNLDPTDVSNYKRCRITINGTNDFFEVRVIGWNVLLNPNDWDPLSEIVLTFTDTNNPTGRIGIGPWGQGGFGAWNSTTNDPDNATLQINPVGAGWFMDNLIVKVDGTNAFEEDWETATQYPDLPAGWNNPYANFPVGTLLGNWNVSGHGTLANFTFPYGTPQTGTTEFPKGDGLGPILLGPDLTNQNYVLETEIIPWDDGGMGFVYDFADTNNYARVLFNSQVPLPGEMLRGVNIGRMSGGVWTDMVVGDNTFIYTPGRRFTTRFANNNGEYTLTTAYTDNPTNIFAWKWNGPAVNPTNRVGLAIWDMPDAHYSYFRASSLPVTIPYVPFEITAITLSGGNVILDISKPVGSNYHVLRATDVLGPYVTNAANQSGAQYIEPAGTATYFYKLQLLP